MTARPGRATKKVISAVYFGRQAYLTTAVPGPCLSVTVPPCEVVNIISLCGVDCSYYLQCLLLVGRLAAVAATAAAADAPL